MRGDEDQVAGDLGNEKAPESEKADDIRASGDYAEDDSKQHRVGRTVGRQGRDWGWRDFFFR